jgi:hypothetical protein
MKVCGKTVHDVWGLMGIARVKWPHEALSSGAQFKCALIKQLWYIKCILDSLQLQCNRIFTRPIVHSCLLRVLWPCLLNPSLSPYISPHSAMLFTSFFPKKHIKSLTFYITSFTLHYYSNKKITTKQNFFTFQYYFFIFPYQSLLFF